VKKVPLFTFVLAVCGMLYNTAFAQEKPRYRITFIKTQGDSGPAADTRSATVVTVVNQSNASCTVRVAWFRQNGTSVCTGSQVNVNAGGAAQICSRNLPAWISACNAGGFCPTKTLLDSTNGAALNGTAVVATSCDLMAVEARVYYTGNSAVGDNAVSAVSNSRVVFIGEANLGD
jgi:hypothetical protein